MSLFRKKTTETQPTPQSIYDYAREVKDRFDEVAHPAELAKDAAWSRAVDGVLLLRLTIAELLTFALGENHAVASLALCAVACRGDASAVETILEQINTYVGDWTKYFALAALGELVPAPQPLLGRLFVTLNDDWHDGYSRFLMQFIRDFVRRRVRGGEPATFGNALATAAAPRIADARSLLAILDRELVEPMRAELEAHTAQQVDLDYLRAVGSIHDGTRGDAPVEHELLADGATFIEQTIAAEQRRSVLILGEHGVGKSTVIRAAADRLRARGWVVFEAGAPELLAGMSYIGEIEDRMRRLIKQLGGGRRIVWIVPRMQELAFAGTHRNSPSSVLDWILPEVDNGSIAVIGELSAGAYQKLVQQKPRVRASFVSLRIDPLPEDATLDLARRWAGEPPVIGDEVLAEAWQLTTQYLGMSVAPGNLLGLLETTRTRLRAIGGDAEERITLDDLLLTLEQLTGLPRSILDEREGLDLAELRAHFAARVLGQPEAIDVLVERVAMIKAGVTDPTRPFGVFLFAGPTGTGKTEVAKSLAEFLFGSAERMVRLDMSEFKNADSLARLTGDGDGGESLVDTIRKQPFSIVLLDELEKAHPNVWDLFLQVFDDGRLTDRRGVTADFRHAIVIMTSNIGAAIQTSGRAGFAESAAPAFHTSSVAKALERELRKEFLNRIDRVVVFRPLSRETMRGILRKEIALAFRRRGLRNRNWAVEWDESAIELLLTAGFTGDLGARPLKRAIERHLLTPLAEIIVTRRAPAGDQFLFIRDDNGKLAIDFVDPDADLGQAPPPDPLPNADLHRSYTALRAIVDSSEWAERKSIALSMTSLPEFWSSPERFEILGEAETRDRIESALAGAGSLLQRLHARAPADLVRRVAQQLWLVGIAIDDLREKRPSDAVIAVESRDDTPAASAWAQRIAGMYRSWARLRGMRAEIVNELTNPYRLTMAVSGFGAHTLLAPEHGLHVQEVPNGHGFDRVAARVRVAPDLDALAAATGDRIVVRRYREQPSALVRDSVRKWRSGRVEAVLGGEFDVIGARD
jgi:ATP-dependent Clp protease ATP-binding subunit ClpC